MMQKVESQALEFTAEVYVLANSEHMEVEVLRVHSRSVNSSRLKKDLRYVPPALTA